MADGLLSHQRLRPWATVLTVGWVGYWILLLISTHTPHVPGQLPSFQYADKVMHCSAYFLLACGCVISRRARSPHLSSGWLALWLGILAVYAALDELLQPLTGRDTDSWDWVADCLGIVVAMLLAWRWWGRETVGGDQAPRAGT